MNSEVATYHNRVTFQKMVEDFKCLPGWKYLRVFQNFLKFHLKIKLFKELCCMDVNVRKKDHRFHYHAKDKF